MMLFDKSPDAVLPGFMVSFIAELCCVALFPLIGLAVIIPGSMAALLLAVAPRYSATPPAARLARWPRRGEPLAANNRTQFDGESDSRKSKNPPFGRVL